MLNVPRTKNEAIHVPLNDAAVAALRVVHSRGEGKGRVFQSAQTAEPLENGRHWFDDAVAEAQITTSDIGPNDASSSDSRVVVRLPF